MMTRALELDRILFANKQLSCFTYSERLLSVNVQNAELLPSECSAQVLKLLTVHFMAKGCIFRSLPLDEKRRACSVRSASQPGRSLDINKTLDRKPKTLWNEAINPHPIPQAPRPCLRHHRKSNRKPALGPMNLSEPFPLRTGKAGKRGLSLETSDTRQKG